MPRIISLTISIVGYKYERPFQRLVDDLINYIESKLRTLQGFIVVVSQKLHIV